MAAVVLTLIGVLIGVLVTQDSESDSLAKDLREAGAALPRDLQSGNKLGLDSAPVKLTQYEDFQCPFCLRYTAVQEPVLVEEYVKTGKVQIIYQHFPGLGRESAWAANASQCAADQNKFWEYQNRLFLIQAEAGQGDTERLNIGRFDLTELKKLGREVGMPKADEFEQCVDNLKFEEVVNQHQRDARAVGISGTPGFLLNGRRLSTGTPSVEEWRKLLDEAVTAAGSGQTVVPATATATKPAGTTTTPAAASPTAAATATAASPIAGTPGASPTR